MALYILSDTHLSLTTHKPMEIFGSRWKNHDEKIIQIWKETVKTTDTVIIGGDISWGISLSEAKEDLLLLGTLPGKKIFLRGNHDYWWSTLSKNRHFLEENQITSIDFLQNNAICAEGFVICGTRGWYSDADATPTNSDYKKIVARESLRLQMSLESSIHMQGERIAIFHFPPVFGDYVCRELINILHQYQITRCYYGHIHGLYRIPPQTTFEGIRFILTSADYLGFHPLKIEHNENI
jgi:hypothetical protein